jgi:NifB/MoaA-like Fe-S oxidoreductase
VRWLQREVAAGLEQLAGWRGRRIGVVTGTAMARLMPMVLEPLARATGADFELIPVVNTLFGASVTTAGLLPGTAVQTALRERRDLDLALLPGESVNDDGLLMDSMQLELLAASVPMEVRLSRNFVDALGAPVAA